MREVMYSPPDGEGPTIERETHSECDSCRYLKRGRCTHPTIIAKDPKGHYIFKITNRYYSTPSWCPIVSADTEGWDKRLKGEV